ncbi:MAG: HNH endonuclease [Sedimentisphaerales bacterium]|nr:HNH endonuclease [Sedimentisphaerales bacterium]HNY80047.1 HNH endonuclease [Sedimentisphaerales bacterium]HOC64930.1 HNH endonuclease [Sedimentisphaerales bacterium]HOH65902.1 HNH endonuclease [Sedimentisphaerales bacterium]HQA91486.1 HNH endonuclease [Sedimentisphaerales bacterium]
MNERDEAEAKARRQRCCANCVFGERLRTRWLRVILTRWPGLLICFHKAGAGGEISEVTACSVCPNFRARRAPTVQSAPRESSDPAIRYISLTRGKHAIVDAADYPALAKYKWYAQRADRTRTFYACRSHRGRPISMHREIMKPPKGMVVDHINGNGLDNRRCNLRICTQLQNSQNSRRRKPGKSQFRGVFPRGEKWQAAIQHDGKPMYLGLFDEEVEAAKARDRKAYELAGEFAVLNFPGEAGRRP